MTIPTPLWGRFIVLEGGEGTGKSTQASLLAQRLEAAAVPVISLREPGGTAIGDRVRELLLDPAHTGLDSKAELLLYEASRAELVARVIRPSLDEGIWVVCDRYTDSTIAYQGHGRCLDLEWIASLNEWATAGLVPSLSIVLDIDPELGVARATGMGADRLEAEDLAFHQRVRKGFLEVAARPGHVLVDASVPVGEVAESVWEAVSRRGLLPQSR